MRLSRKRCAMNVKKENFKRISDSRIKKINDLISKLHNLINPSFYEFDDKEIDNMFDSIQNELNKQKEIFLNEREKIRKKKRL